MMPVLCGLGIWQLDRAEQKREFLRALEEQEQKPGIRADQLGSVEPDGIGSVRFRGQYLKHGHYLLENRSRNGVQGVEVLSLFEDNSGQVFLINRGWKATSLDRSLAVDPEPVSTELEFIADIHRPQSEGFRLGPLDFSGSSPKRIQYLDMEQLRQDAGSGLYPWSFRLREGEPGSLQARWPVAHIQPEKHTAYAMQWFTMAALLLILYLAYNSELFRGKNTQV